jgi:hypothetical protein
MQLIYVELNEVINSPAAEFIISAYVKQVAVLIIVKSYLNY